MTLKLVAVFIDEGNPEYTKRLPFEVETDYLWHHSCGLMPKVIQKALEISGQTVGLISIEFQKEIK